MNQYIKDYGIIAKPLHNITKKGAKGPPPWIKGSDYDLAFIKLKAIISDSKLYLHHKDKLRRLFLEVDASDVGWGACAYQMFWLSKVIRKMKVECALATLARGKLYNGSAKAGPHMS